MSNGIVVTSAEVQTYACAVFPRTVVDNRVSLPVDSRDPMRTASEARLNGALSFYYVDRIIVKVTLGDASYATQSEPFGRSKTYWVNPRGVHSQGALCEIYGDDNDYVRYMMVRGWSHVVITSNGGRQHFDHTQDEVLVTT